MQLKCSQNQKRSKDISRSTSILLKATRIIFVCKENQNNDFIQQFFSPELLSSAILESITTNVNKAD